MFVFLIFFCFFGLQLLAAYIFLFGSMSAFVQNVDLHNKPGSAWHKTTHGHELAALLAMPIMPLGFSSAPRRRVQNQWKSRFDYLGCISSNATHGLLQVPSIGWFSLISLVPTFLATNANLTMKKQPCEDASPIKKWWFSIVMFAFWCMVNMYSD